jgi:hypothetical protein
VRKRDWESKERYYRLSEAIEKYSVIEKALAALTPQAPASGAFRPGL